MRKRIGSMVAIFSLIVFASQPASSTTILPPNSFVAGKSIADWTAAWWTWALQAPAAQNPLTDTTGAFANVNNNGPVFFVAGTFGTSGPVSRSFQVPGGKPVLIPLINFFDTEPAEIDPPTATLADRQNAANTIVAGWLNAVNPANLFASIDAVPVANPSSYLEVTGLFSAGPVQAGSLIASLGVPVGADLSPTKSAGYWLMVEDLPPGLHTLNFGGSSDAFTPAANCCTNSEIPASSVDVTDVISVKVLEPASAFLLLPGFIGLLALTVLGRKDARC